MSVRLGRSEAVSAVGAKPMSRTARSASRCRRGTSSWALTVITAVDMALPVRVPITSSSRSSAAVTVTAWPLPVTGTSALRRGSSCR